jgi:CHAT domain-containing protein/Tfp pilus assembly protein PilF
MGRYGDALALYQQAMEIRKKALGEKHPDYATSLDRLAGWYTTMGRYSEALPLYQQALAITKESLGEKHPDYADSLDSLAGWYSSMGEYGKALRLYEQALGITKRALGERHPSYAYSLSRLASLYDSMGRYEDALPLYQQALEIRKEVYGQKHPSYGGSLSSLASLYGSMGQYKDALPLYEQALGIEKEAHGEKHPAYANVLSSLASLYETTGKHGDALPLYQQALEIRKQAFGEKHPTYASSLNNLASLYESRGRYDDALPLYQKALEIRKEVYGEKHPWYASSLNSLAGWYASMGRNENALPLYQKALEIRKKVYGEKHSVYGNSLNSLAILYHSIGKNEKALPLFQQASRIWKEVFGERHREYATSLNNLAMVYEDMKQSDKASVLSRQALEIWKEALGEKHPLYATGLNNLAALYRDTDLASAQALALQALPIALQAGDPTTSKAVYRNLRAIAAKQGKPELAIFFGKEAVNSLQAMRRHQAKLNKELQESFLKKNESDYRKLADLLIEAGRFSEAQQVLGMLKEQEYHEFIRGESAGGDAGKQTATLNSTEREWQSKLDKYSAKLIPLAQEEAALRNRFKTLTPEEAKRLTQLQAQLAEANVAFKQLIDGIYASTSKLAGTNAARDLNLHSSQALKDTLRVLGKGVVLLNYVVTEDKLHVLLTTPKVQLAASTNIRSADLNQKVFEFREVLKSPGRDPVPAARALYDVLLRPIAAQLEQAQATTLLVSLDGALRYIPMEALHDGTNYLAERYPVVIFTESGRDKMKDRPQDEWHVAAMGVSKEIPGFAKLDWVKTELQGVVKQADGNGLLPGQIALDEQFTDKELQAALAGDERPPVVHLATHFVFHPGVAANSFLLLGDGSHLTVSQLEAGQQWNFGGVDLVTLSACETAVGEVRENSGGEVEGLAMVMQNKGAKSILATLWPVEDQSTSTLMREFYRLREEKLTKAEALRQAKLGLLRGDKIQGAHLKVAKRGVELDSATRPLADNAPAFQVDPSRPFAHPYYWAPFILMGNGL